MRADETPRQVAGAAPLGLALLLERGGVALVAPAQALAPGVALLDLGARVPGDRPASAAACRERACPATVLTLRVEATAVVAWLRRLVGRLPGWRLEHVTWDMLEGTGDFWTWTLRGRDAAGAAASLRLELGGRAQAGRLLLRPRRCWLLGPSTTAERVWDALLRRLAGPGVTAQDGWLEIDPLRATLGPAFAAAGWRLPAGRGLVGGEVRVTDGAVIVTLRADAAEVTWPAGQVPENWADGLVLERWAADPEAGVGNPTSWSSGQVSSEPAGWSSGQVVSGPAGWSSGQVVSGPAGWSSGQVSSGPAGWSSGQIVSGSAGWSSGQVRSAPVGRGWLASRLGGRWARGQGAAPGPATGFDPLAAVRDAATPGDADRRLQALAREVPAMTAILARERARRSRFGERARCVAAVRAWISVRPADAEAWWLLVVQQARAGELDGLDAALAGLAALPAAADVRVRRVLARALALHRRERVSGARALLEPLVAGLTMAPAELQAAVWRALARVRAADATASARAVEDAVTAALGEEGWRRRGEAGELRVQVAGALLASGRNEADTARLLRRVLGERRVRSTRRGERVAVGEDGSRTSVRIVADYFAQEGRWSELVSLLGGALVRLDGAAKVDALRQIARIHRHHLHDPARAEQALRAALPSAGDDRAAIEAELKICAEMQGVKTPE